MHHRYAVLGALSLAALVSGIEPLAFASPPSSNAPSEQAATAPAHSSRANVRLEMGRSTAWAGQAIPITVKAMFRAVEGVTLEGAPQLKSDSVFTAEIAPQPGQSTEIVDGEPILVATWTGTITPSTTGPLALSVELPVRIRYHDAVVQRTVPDPMLGDPFANMDIDPADPTSIQRLFQSFQQSFSQPFERSIGRVHDDAIALKAATPAAEIRALPAAGQPASFSGAVGHFHVRASVAEPKARASEPLTLRITVQGEGDLDRVDLPGLETSTDWKAYPTTSKIEAHVAGKRAGRKTFEQVLIPLHGGQLPIPAIALPFFDPATGRYTTVETAPLTIAVEGATAEALRPEPVITATAAVPSVAAVAEAPSNVAPPPSPSSLVEDPRAWVWRLAPVPVLLLTALAVRQWRRRRDDEKSLRRTLRDAAKQGTVAAFFEAARCLIVVHFAKRWGIAREEVTVDSLLLKLGPTAEPLVAALSTADALRFGRGDLQPTDLPMLCSLIEGSLRDAA